MTFTMALVMAFSWGQALVPIQGRLVIRPGLPAMLHPDRTGSVRGPRCLDLERSGLARKAWLVDGLQVSGRLRPRAPASPSDCLILESLKPVVFDPAGATIRQGPPPAR